MYLGARLGRDAAFDNLENRMKRTPRSGRVASLVLFAISVSIAGSLLAQNAPDKNDKTLIVNGKPVSAEVVQVNGHSYVDVATVAQITNGSVTLEPNRVLLSVPVANSAAIPERALSKDFVRASLADLADMREWRGAIGTMITYGLAVSDAWAQGYHDRAQADLTQTTVAASTDSDREALALLKSEFDKLAGWSADALAARQALDGARTIDPNTLSNDQTLANITDCGEFLNGMLASGVFSDSSSCH